MRVRRPLSALAALGVASASLLGLVTGAEAAPAVTVTPLHFAVQIGPDAAKTCDVVGDLYLPADASPDARVPAILTTNGFGGSKDDQAGIGNGFAARGYAVLSYSGLGFGGSDCKITLDDPDFDGKAARQLVSYLGGQDGIAFTDADHTDPAPPLDVVRLDAIDHAGQHSAHDPRVGMVGGSYGGQVQFAVAGIDPRVDTIVPIITWNDLSYSLGPNNTDQTTGVSTATPGATKLTWGLLFSALGVVDGLQNAQSDPSRLLPCPNFATFVCPALVTAGTAGYFIPPHVAALRHASVASYMKKVTVPTLLVQGQGDTLFNLNEAAATYRALKKQGTPVTMIWQSWGHSDSTPAPGEIDLDAPDPSTQYETARISAWFDHYLKDTGADTGPAFSYFRDWVDYSGIATPAYGTSSSFPVGTDRTFYLSGTELASSERGLTRRAQTFLTPPAGLPTSLNELDALGSYATIPVPEVDLPGTFARWTSPSLTDSLDVVGSPSLTVKVNAFTAALTQGAGPTGKLVLFVRVQDVAPDGTASDIHALTAPVRVPDVRKPFTVTLPGIVHRFAAGHSVRLVVAGGSLNYRGGLVPTPVSVVSGSAAQALTLPVVQ